MVYFEIKLFYKWVSRKPRSSRVIVEVFFRKAALTVVVGRWRTEGECGGMNVCQADGLESPLFGPLSTDNFSI